MSTGAERARQREAQAEAARQASYERNGLRAVVTGVRKVGGGIVAVRDLVKVQP